MSIEDIDQRPRKAGMKPQYPAPIKVRKWPPLRCWYWQCAMHPVLWRGVHAQPTWADAMEAAEEHLRVEHRSGSALVGQVQINTRCTCSDQPRLAYPHFSVCPVHARLLNRPMSTHALLGFASGSQRLREDASTLQERPRVTVRYERDNPVPGDPEALRGREKAAHATGEER